MACATLKRSLDSWGEPGVSLNSNPAKRRRCIPICTTPPRATNSVLRMQPANNCVTNNVATCQRPIIPIQRRTATTFPDVSSRKLTSEFMAENIKAEILKLEKQRRFKLTSGKHNDSADIHLQSGSNSAEEPLFTFTQVGFICDRMIREFESEIRAEYDKVLTSKLSEQYDAYVKFTFDQIHRTYSSSTTPSYLS